MAKEGFRFVVAGSINTVLTLAVYQLCLVFMSHEIAYGISWLLGIAFLVIVYPSKVFSHNNSSLTKKVFIALLYLITFILGLRLLNWLVLSGIPAEFAIFIVLAFAMIINFFGMRMILRR